MPQKTALPMSRIDARILLSVREAIDRAAAMQGRTRTDFLIAAALEKAEQSLVRLALEDQRTLAAVLLSEETETRRTSLKSCHPSTRSGWKADESAFSFAACGNIA